MHLLAVGLALVACRSSSHWFTQHGHIEPSVSPNGDAVVALDDDEVVLLREGESPRRVAIGDCVAPWRVKRVVALDGWSALVVAYEWQAGDTTVRRWVCHVAFAAGRVDPIDVLDLPVTGNLVVGAEDGWLYATGASAVAFDRASTSSRLGAVNAVVELPGPLTRTFGVASDGAIVVGEFDRAQGTSVEKMRIPLRDGPPLQLVPSRDGRWLGYERSSGKIGLVEVATGRVVFEDKLAAWTSVLAVADGRVLVGHHEDRPADDPRILVGWLGGPAEAELVPVRGERVWWLAASQRLLVERHGDLDLIELL